MSVALTRLPDPIHAPDFYESVTVKRALSWIIDVTLVAILCVLLLPFTAFLGLLVFPAMMLAVGALYRWITISARSGTWGMRLMGIELRNADGDRLSSDQAFMHTALYIGAVLVAPLQLISVILMLTTPRGQSLSDMILGTAMLNRAV
ncbi:RDD family protein [Aestuariibius insulae]|uniref:RDD family protein n=1 Tax=Aestuariibius insulae TaxID=2058287 RepID=UPI00345E70CC